MIEINRRPRRNRKNEVVRAMVQENHVLPSQLIYPVFIISGVNRKEAILSMPGIYRFSLDLLKDEIRECLDLGIKTFALFPALENNLKTPYAEESWNPEGLYLHAIRAIKQKFPEAQIMSDVAMDPYSSDGHDGLVVNGEIVNDDTLPILAKMAVAQAYAGADIVGPSDMMDGRIGYIRNALDEAGFTQTSIMAYTAKYASSFYGPFRDALDSAPKFGDKKTYQMNPANGKEAMIEAQLDFEEGADFLMVKPGLPYLDVIRQLADAFSIPIAAYNVSGEYAMIKATAEKGWLEHDRTMVECLTSFKRAGAQVILTYFAKEYAIWFKNQ